MKQHHHAILLEVSKNGLIVNIVQIFKRGVAG
jgi:hypothetical protein